MSFRICPECGAEGTSYECRECGRIERTPVQIKLDVAAFQRVSSPRFGQKLSDQQCGLYGKYDVKRVDGSSEPGGKHEHCKYYVLDLEHDEYAAPALRAYVDACRAKYPALAADIDSILNARSAK